jgi:membrane associated rhomboid family serine protease
MTWILPITDDTPRIGTPIVTWSIIAVCVLVLVWLLSLGTSAAESTLYQFGMIPARLFGTAELRVPYIPAWVTIFTSMFMHGGWVGLGANTLYLYIFGDNVEDSMGHVRYLVFYLLCGVAGTLTQAVINPASTIPMFGANGAISGVLGAYVLLYPHARVRTFIFTDMTRRLPVLILIGLWFLLQLASAWFSYDEPLGMSVAHIGGFVAGMALAPLLKKRDVKLFQPAVPPRGVPMSYAEIHKLYQKRADRMMWVGIALIFVAAGMWFTDMPPLWCGLLLLFGVGCAFAASLVGRFWERE